MQMAKTSAKSSPETIDPNDTSERDAAVDAVLSDNPEIAAEMDGLTYGEKLIRLRQRGLIGFDVQ